MAKNRPGLPDGFEIKLDNPVQLGDYLDEDNSGNAVKAIALKRAQAAEQVEAKKAFVPPQPVSTASPVVLSVRTLPPAPEPRIPERNDAVLDLNEARRRASPRAQSPRRQARGQFNMRPETVKMFEDFVEFVQRYSLQPDTKQSEIFEAIVGLLHDAKEEMSFADVPRRGKWGTPTARAFPTALGNAFAKAISIRFTKLGSQ